MKSVIGDKLNLMIDKSLRHCEEIHKQITVLQEDLREANKRHSWLIELRQEFYDCEYGQVELKPETADIKVEQLARYFGMDKPPLTPVSVESNGDVVTVDDIVFDHSSTECETCQLESVPPEEPPADTRPNSKVVLDFIRENRGMSRDEIKAETSKLIRTTLPNRTGVANASISTLLTSNKIVIQDGLFYVKGTEPTKASPVSHADRVATFITMAGPATVKTIADGTSLSPQEVMNAMGNNKSFFGSDDGKHYHMKKKSS